MGLPGHALLLWFIMAALMGAGVAIAAPMPLAQAERRHVELVGQAREILYGPEQSRDWSRARILLEEARHLTFTTPRGNFTYRSREGDFFFGWLLCQSGGESAEGRALLDHTLRNDAWPPDKQEAIRLVLETCQTPAVEKKPPPAEVRIENSFKIVAIQKGGRWSQPVRLDPKAVPPPVDWEGRDSTLSALRNLFPPSPIIESRPFLVTGPFSAAYLGKLADTVLLPYYRYLSSTLGVDYDWGTITVLVSRDHDQFARLAGLLYHVDQKNRFAVESAIAFTDLPNRTMMAICGVDPSNCTSLTHELFHLINSKVFDHAPWWLHEGMAELYEAGEIVNGDFRPRAGWRKDKAHMGTLETQALEDLLMISKNDPAFHSPPGKETAMARARYFCLYLHEKKALVPVYDAMRLRDGKEAAADPAGLAVLTKTLNLSLSEITEDFRGWFQQAIAPQPAPPGH